MKRTLVLIALIAVLCMVVVACSSHSFDAKELASINVTGANGFGSLVVNLDSEQLNSLIEEESRALSDNDEQAFKRLFQREAAINSLIYEADKTVNLKNGDEIVIRAEYDEKLAKSAGVRFRNLKYKYVIAGLRETLPIDVSNNVDLTFVGFNGRGVASLSLSGDVEQYRSGFDFVFTGAKTKLSNGDLVEVKVIPNNDFLTGNGKIARNATLSFEVKGLIPLKSIDLFKDLVLVFDGVSDHGIVSFDTTRLPVEWVEAGSWGQAPVQYMAVPLADLANGDVVRVEASVDEEWFAERGLKTGQVIKEFSVSGLKEYPRNLDNIDLMPLFDKISARLEQDLEERLTHNYWNDDFRTGEPVSRWEYAERHGVSKIYYGYKQSDRAQNFVTLIYKVTIEGLCQEITPYQSAYLDGDRESATLYLAYVVDDIMYDRSDIDDFRDFNLKFHSDVELELIARFKEQYGGAGVQIVEVPVPEQVRYP